ncbi:MAG: winged helix-turn-helix domain-containing protein [Amaricoccus sp.]
MPPRHRRQADLRCISFGEDPKLVLVAPRPAPLSSEDLRPHHPSTLASKLIAKSASKLGPEREPHKPELTERLRRNGDEIALTPREYDILRVLVQHAGKVLTHAFLIRQVWGGTADVQNLRVHVRQLRQKIEPDPQQPTHIRTETGVGYRFSDA